MLIYDLELSFSKGLRCNPSSYGVETLLQSLILCLERIFFKYALLDKDIVL